MHSSLNDNLCTTIVSLLGLANIREESDVPNFYNRLFSPAQHIPKHHVQIIGGNGNVQFGNNGNDQFGCYYLPNTNGEYQADFSLKNRIACLNPGL